jgi:hypothetical protein
MSGSRSETTLGEVDEDSVTRERSRPVEWLLLEGSRPLVAATVLFGVLVVTVTAMAVGLIAVADTGAMTRSYAALVAGNFTLITITVSINQLVLSREFDTPDELYERIEEVIDYRESVEQAAGGTIAPVTPAAFLDFLGRRIHEHAETLREEMAEPADPADQRLDGAIETYTETLFAQTDHLTTTLERAEGGAFTTLLVILQMDFTGSLHATHGIKTRHGRSLSPEAMATLEDLADLLEFVGVARQYFKTLSIQQELSDLSRAVVYTGIPALLVPLLVSWVYGVDPGTTVSGPPLYALAVLTIVVGFAPFAVLLSHLTRIATLTRRTASLMPFRFDDRSPGRV